MIGHHPASSTSEPASRRRLLRLIGAGSAALAASLMPRNGTQAGHDGTNVLHLGEDNAAAAKTSLAANVQPNALMVLNETGGGIHAHAVSGIGLLGSSDTFRGVYGHSESDTGVQGDSVNGAGVFGASENGPGVQGASFSGTTTGVEGSSDSGTGVEGHSNSGRGVSAFSQDGFGVWADSEHVVGVGGFSGPDLGVLGVGGGEDSDAEGDGIGGFSHNSIGGRFVSFNGIGLRALSPGDEHPALQAASGLGTDVHQTPAPDGGLALEVIGKARFSTAGSGAVPAGENSVSVANSAVTAHSHITVTLASDPGSRQLHWVERQPGTGFTVQLTSAPPPQRPETDFTYLIVEPVVE